MQIVRRVQRRYTVVAEGVGVRRRGLHIEQVQTIQVVAKLQMLRRGDRGRSHGPGFGCTLQTENFIQDVLVGYIGHWGGNDGTDLRLWNREIRSVHLALGRGRLGYLRSSRLIVATPRFLSRRGFGRCFHRCRITCVRCCVFGSQHLGIGLHAEDLLHLLDLSEAVFAVLTLFGRENLIRDLDPLQQRVQQTFLRRRK